MINPYAQYNSRNLPEYSILSLKSAPKSYTKIAFLDRDGVLIEDVGHISSADDVVVYPYANDILRTLKSQGYMIAVVTNQSSIPKGLSSIFQYKEVTTKFLESLTQSSLPDYIIASFHTSTDTHKNYYHWRKPGTGMFNFLLNKYSIQPENCIMLGDKLTDLIPAHKLKFRQLIHVYERFHSDQLNIVRRWSQLLKIDIEYVQNLQEVSRILV